MDTLIVLFLVLSFFVIYLFLPRAMWSHYVADSGRFIFVFGFMMVIVAIWTAVAGHIPWFFVLGYSMMDPISYTMTAYQRIVSEQKRAKQLVEKDPLWPRNPTDKAVLPYSKSNPIYKVKCPTEGCGGFIILEEYVTRECFVEKNIGQRV